MNFNRCVNKVLLLLILGGFYFCKPPVQDQDKNENLEQNEKIIKINKYLVAKDSELIEDYIHRKDWKVQRSKTGLIYEIYHKGHGKQAKTGKRATLNFRVELLDGTLCYSSDSLGPKTFLIGQGGVESGLEEGVLLLHEGDKAHFIMPPHLAHGLIGDDNKIGGHTIIVYDVELLRIE